MKRITQALIAVALLLPLVFLQANPLFMLAGSPPAAGGATPAWGGAVTLDSGARWTQVSDSATTVIGLDQSIAQDATVCVAIQSYGPETISSVTDSQGNTYGVTSVVYFNGTAESLYIAYGYLDTALTASDSITINWASTTYTWRGGTVAYFTGCSASGQPDQTGSASAYGASVTASASTTATNTALFGLILIQNTSRTYSGGSWTTIGSVHNYGASHNSYYLYSTASSAGAQDPGGTISAADTHAVSWIALK